ncbi:MAG: molybdate ABC transporter substrate-binding protein, partial [Methanospirillum sp.]
MRTRTLVFTILVLAALLCAAGCTSTGTGQATSTPTPVMTTTAPSSELTVFAAASLKDAFTECGRQFEANHTGTKVVFNFDGSQVLVTQLKQGAYADIFASANTAQMNNSKNAGLVKNETVKLFVKNRLAILVPAANPASIKGLQDLANPGVRLVIGTPDVPVGDYARQLLNKTGNDTSFGPSFKEKVLANVVSEETNVNSLATKVVLGEADAGIAYASDVPAAQRDKVTVIELPDSYQVVANYPIGVLGQSKHPVEAQAFVDFVLS